MTALYDTYKFAANVPKRGLLVDGRPGAVADRPRQGCALRPADGPRPALCVRR